jgi:acyltransferase
MPEGATMTSQPLDIRGISGENAPKGRPWQPTARNRGECRLIESSYPQERTVGETRPNHEDTPPRQFIPSLHGLRGLMAAWVVAFHGTTSPIFGITIFKFGFLAVDVFFILSGYVLMHTHAATMAQPSLGPTQKFFVRRWRRTIPLFLACFILEVMTFVYINGALPSYRRAIESLFLMEGWISEGMDLNNPMWSLGVEWIGYLIFPVVALYVVRMRSPFVCMGLLACLSLAEIVGFGAAGIQTLDYTIPRFAVLRMASGFLSGCVLWQLHQIRSNHSYNDCSLIVAVMGAALLLAYGPQTAVLPFLVLLVHGVVQAGRIGTRLFGNPVVLFLGRVSFALYLCHYLIMHLIHSVQPTGLSMVEREGYTIAFYAVSLVSAFALCKAIEEPMRRSALLRI